MNGRVDVGCDGGFSAPTAAAPFTSSTVGCTTALTADTNVTLTIEPGVILYGGTGQSWLAVNRGNRISAVGTSTRPIVFTSRDNVLGLNSDSSQGQWGGVVLMGRARTTDCTTGTVAAGTCERQTEGSADPARFGGANDADNSGRMSFVQIRYSGFILGANVELQALTTEAHRQRHRARSHPEPQQLGRRRGILRRQRQPEVLHRHRRGRRQPRRRYRRADERPVRPAAAPFGPGRCADGNRQQRQRSRHAAHQC